MITHAASRKHYYTVLLDRSLSAVFLLFVYGKCSYVHSPFSIQNLPLLPCPELLVWLTLPENPAPP